MIMNQGQFPTYKNLYPVQTTPTTSVELVRDAFDLIT